MGKGARGATEGRMDRKAFRISFLFSSLCAKPGMLLRLGRITHQVFWKGEPTQCKERRATRELRFARKQFSCHHAVFACNSSPSLAFKSLRPHAKLSNCFH